MDELEKIQAQIAELQKKAQDIQAQKKASVIEDMKSKIKAYGITAKDLGFAEKATVATKTSTVAIKYKQGENTWTGRGRQPKWVADYVAKGGNLDDLLVG